MKNNFTGKVVLITGAAGGIGRATWRKFEEHGATVYATDIAGCPEDVEEGGKARFIPGDLSDPVFIQRCVQDVLERERHIDILVNNAGICPRTPLPDISLSEWRKVLDINLTVPFQLSRECLKTMAEQKSGSIVNITSLAGKTGGIAVGAHYSASKAALACITKTMALYGAPCGVRVNAVAPGIVDTAINRAASDEQRENYIRNIPLGYFASPEEIAGPVLFLSSEDASYITGAVLDVNGGFLMD